MKANHEAFVAIVECIEVLSRGVALDPTDRANIDSNVAELREYAAKLDRPAKGEKAAS